MNVGNNPLYGGAKMAIATWNAATTTWANNASASSTAGSIWLPDGALITKAFYHVATTCADGNDDSQTLALGYTGATGAFVAAVAISASTNVWDAGAHGTLVGMGAALGADSAHDTALEVIALNSATMLHLTAAKELLLTTADDEAVEVGKLSLFVEYVQTGDFS